MELIKLTHLKQELAAHFNTSEFTLRPIVGGASARRYFLLTFDKRQYFPRREVLVMVVPLSEIQSLTDYFEIDFYLKRHGVPTPTIFEMNQDRGWIFREYIAHPTLEQQLHAEPHRTEELLYALVDLLLQIQVNCQFEAKCPCFQRFFDEEKFMFEFNFHVKTQLLNFYLGYEMGEEEELIFQNFAETISTELAAAERVFVHRDYQSSNIFLTASNGKPAFQIIDFQDARSGTPVYDLVSALWDSYIKISEELRSALLQYYFLNLSKLNLNWDWAYFQRQVDLAAIQRKLHDAGAFAYNFRRFSKKRYIRYIPGALQMALQKMRKYPEFESMYHILNQVKGVKVD